MLLNKHGSFYIRNGWPTKIINAINADHLIFSPNNELDAVDNIGVGRVMVKAMRYWASAMGLVTEDKISQGVTCNLTNLGNVIAACILSVKTKVRFGFFTEISQQMKHKLQRGIGRLMFTIANHSAKMIFVLHFILMFSVLVVAIKKMQ